MEHSEFFLYLNIVMLVLMLMVTSGCGEKDEIITNTKVEFAQIIDKNRSISDIHTSLNQDNLSCTKKEIDYDIVKPVNFVSKYSYDTIENIGKVVSEIDNDNDGVIDCVILKFNTYDENGKVSENLSETDDNNDGIIDFVSSKKYIYNPNGSLLQKTHEIDNDNDGIVDYINIEDTVYDKDECITKKITQCDNNNDGIIDSVDISIYTYTYDENGNMLDISIDLSSIEL